MTYPRWIWLVILLLAGGEYALMLVAAWMAPPLTAEQRCQRQAEAYRSGDGVLTPDYYARCMERHRR